MTTKPKNLSYEDFVKFDIRAGTIAKAETIPKSKKLLKLEVSFGPEIGPRIILAGIASSAIIYNADVEKCDPTILVGQRVVAILNLAPRQMMGIESHGMILACHDKNNAIWLIQPGSVEDGTEVG
jgi:methionyl-tRNA synthetase